MLKSSFINNLFDQPQLLMDSAQNVVFQEQKKDQSLFSCAGNCRTVKDKLNTILQNGPDSEKIKRAQVTIIGDQFKDMDINCLAITVCFGICCLFPLFFMLCGWWKKKVYPGFEISEQTYSCLENLHKFPNLKSVRLIITDNKLNKRKALIVEEYLRKSQIKQFSLINIAGRYNCEEKQASNFSENFAKIKRMDIQTNISWQDKQA